jgi:uncharacterized integral membrane protein
MADKDIKTVYDAKGNPITVDATQFDKAVTHAGEGASSYPQIVYMARPHEPVKPQISTAVRKKHEDAQTMYPYLNLSEGEYVISAIRRHPIGLLGIWAVVAIAVLLLVVGIVFAMNPASASSNFVTEEALPSLALILLGLVVLMLLGGVLATVVYEGNRFFLTNESVTQHIQLSIFAKKEQTISLANIEDASFTQHGILQTMLNYGSLRLSTEGDETTYRFHFVSDPSSQVATLNNAVEAFKNGRPIEPNDD